MRHRKNLIEMSATHIRMMHKALEQMNIKLQHVIADIMGKSGQLIIQAIIDGERDAERLASFCEKRIREDKRPAIIKSLQGIWKEEHVFELKQSYEIYHYYRNQIKECDRQIEAILFEGSQGGHDTNKKVYAKSNKNTLGFDATEVLQQMTGTDLTQIFGITCTNAMEIISEVGLDMEKWPTVKHFTSWLNLAPNNKISGGKVLSSRIPKKKNAASQIFRIAAFAVQRSKNWLASFYHRIKAKSGTPKAIVATARKIAVIFYKMMSEKVAFNPTPIETYTQDYKNLQVKRLKHKAKTLGLILTELPVT
jgi:transposase